MLARDASLSSLDYKNIERIIEITDFLRRDFNDQPFGTSQLNEVGDPLSVPMRIGSGENDPGLRNHSDWAVAEIEEYH